MPKPPKLKLKKWQCVTLINEDTHQGYAGFITEVYPDKFVVSIPALHLSIIRKEASLNPRKCSQRMLRFIREEQKQQSRSKIH